MNFKKILCLLLILIIAFSFSACDENNTVSNVESSNNSALTEVGSNKASGENITASTESTTVSKEVQNKTSSKESKPTNSSKPVQSATSVNTTTTSKTESTVTNANNYKQPSDSDNNIKIADDGTVSITIPKWFLFKIEPDYNYQLTNKEVNEYKFKSVTKNSDGSATYKIGYNDYHGMLLMSQSSVNAVVYKYKHNIWFSKIDADAGYNNIKIYTKYNSLEDFDDDFGAYIALSGLQTTFYQYMHFNYSVGTTITVYNKDNAVLETYKFPNSLK